MDSQTIAMVPHFPHAITSAVATRAESNLTTRIIGAADQGEALAKCRRPAFPARGQFSESIVWFASPEITSAKPHLTTDIIEAVDQGAALALVPAASLPGAEPLLSIRQQTLVLIERTTAQPLSQTTSMPQVFCYNTPSRPRSTNVPRTRFTASTPLLPRRPQPFERL